MGMFTAVGRGSDNPPRFIVLRSGAAGATDSQGRLLAMIGKGVTFDSGGISIKPADRMEEMKTDKTGACTVISAIATVAALAPGLPLMAVAPAVENMPGPHSTRPGDIVRALNGKSSRSRTRDAEGRPSWATRWSGRAQRRYSPRRRGHPDGASIVPWARRSPAASAPAGLVGRGRCRRRAQAE
jgi:leucyl aminopeptidase